MEKILTEERTKKLKHIKGFMRDAAVHLRDEAENLQDKKYYERMIKNIDTVPLYLFPRNDLAHHIYRIGKYVYSSVVLGQHVQDIRVIKKGNKIIGIEGKRRIELPANLFFNGDVISWEGLKTLAHEYAHDPIRGNPEKIEELFADLISAKVLVKMGTPRRKVLSLFTGREGVYGGFDYREAIKKAITPKKLIKRPAGKQWTGPEGIKKRRKPEIIDITKRKKPFYRKVA